MRDDLSWRSQIVSIFEMYTGEQEDLHDADLQRLAADHIDACRQRIPEFVRVNFSAPGAIDLNRLAWGTDVLVAPFNFVMGFPNFVLRVLAVILDLFRARKPAHWLRRIHLGLPTRVQKTLTAKLMADLLDLPVNPEDATDRLHRRVAFAAREPVRIYVQTRNVAADITAGTVAAVTGILVFSQFTPGSISFGSAVAHLVAREQAVSEFALGEVLGRLYFALFPVNPSLTAIAVALFLVMVTISVVAAFSGVIHDPIQSSTGIHRRRLNQLLDAIQESICQPVGRGYRPKDTFLGRIFDLADWVKGLLSF